MRRRSCPLAILLTIMLYYVCSFSAHAGTVRTVAVNNPDLTLTYSLVNVWSTGFQADVVLQNNGSQEVADWRLDFNLRSQIKNMWSASIVAQDGYTFSVEPVYYTDVIPAGSSIHFGFVSILEESNTISDIVLIDPAYPVEGPGDPTNPGDGDSLAG